MGGREPWELSPSRVAPPNGRGSLTQSPAAGASWEGCLQLVPGGGAMSGSPAQPTFLEAGKQRPTLQGTLKALRLQENGPGALDCPQGMSLHGYTAHTVLSPASVDNCVLGMSTWEPRSIPDGTECSRVFLPSPSPHPHSAPPRRSGARKWEPRSNYRKSDDKMTRAGDKLLIFLGLFCLHLENKLNTVTKYYIYVHTHTYTHPFVNILSVMNIIVYQLLFYLFNQLL